MDARNELWLSPDSSFSVKSFSYRLPKREFIRSHSIQQWKGMCDGDLAVYDFKPCCTMSWESNSATNFFVNARSVGALSRPQAGWTNCQKTGFLTSQTQVVSANQGKLPNFYKQTYRIPSWYIYMESTKISKRMRTFTNTCVCSVKVKCQCWVSPSVTYFWDRFSHWTWRSAFGLGRLTCHLPGPACLHHPWAGSVNTGSHLALMSSRDPLVLICLDTKCFPLLSHLPSPS